MLTVLAEDYCLALELGHCGRYAQQLQPTNAAKESCKHALSTEAQVIWVLVAQSVSGVSADAQMPCTIHIRESSLKVTNSRLQRIGDIWPPDLLAFGT